jgi:hypothetical protein
VVEDSSGRLMRKSARGVWLFRQTDIVNGSPVCKYFVYDMRTLFDVRSSPRLATSNFKEAVRDFERRVAELPDLKKTA